jgi:hypothetical protein
MKKTLAVALLLGAAVPLSAAAADDTLARFEGGIGSQPFARAGAAPGTLATNDVQGVPPGGRPWVIERLRADVKIDGRIKVDGRGLLLAGGNSVGRPGNQTVHARLFCGNVAHNSGAVTVDQEGDFRIESVLAPVPPTPCATPTLLIVNAGGNWFAAGIPKE